MAPGLPPEPLPPWLKKTGIALLVVWAVILVLGAVGELFGIEALQKITDFKRIFLR